MYILLNSSQPVCHLSLVGDERIDDEWNAGRDLAHGLLARIDTLLKSAGKTWTDISGIGVFEGPGSFTGLRIGITVANTIADANKVPIVGVRGDDWQEKAIDGLSSGEDDKVVLPYYDRPVNITTPKK